MGKKKGSSLTGPLPKPLVWLQGEVKTPPFTPEGRQQAGMLLRLLIDSDAVLVLDVYSKKTRKIPDEAIRRCKQRIKRYESDLKAVKKDR